MAKIDGEETGISTRPNNYANKSRIHVVIRLLNNGVLWSRPVRDSITVKGSLSVPSTTIFTCNLLVIRQIIFHFRFACRILLSGSNFVIRTKQYTLCDLHVAGGTYSTMMDPP